MKLFRHGTPGAEKPGLVLTDGSHVDASPLGVDYDEAFFAAGGLQKLGRWGREVERDANFRRLPESIRFGAAICRPSKIVCIGLNYLDHIRETGAKMPPEPVLFFKATTAICGPQDDVWIPRGAGRVDWEVELAVVIGKEARYVTEENAHDFVAGYALHNDYSERAFQTQRGGQWVKGKSSDRFAPIGPYLVTPDDVGDVDSLRMWLTVNGESRQESNTSNMIFKVPTLVSYVSQFMTLLPGDVISTGTPHGVGFVSDPPQFLKEGDRVAFGIERLGETVQTVVHDPRG